MINSKILGSVMVIGIALFLAGAGTMAYFSDTETSSGNTFTAGELDLKVDLVDSSANYEGSWSNKFDETDDPLEPIFNFSDVKPGDNGRAIISLHVYDNPAWGWISIENLEETDGTDTEPEIEAEGGETDGEGELSQNMNVTVSWYKGDYPNGTAPDAAIYHDDDFGISERKIPLDGESNDGMQPLENCVTYYLVIEWEVPTTVGNIIQGDNLSFDLVFGADQYRHQEDLYSEA